MFSRKQSKPKAELVSPGIIMYRKTHHYYWFRKTLRPGRLSLRLSKGQPEFLTVKSKILKVMGYRTNLRKCKVTSHNNSNLALKETSVSECGMGTICKD